MAKIKFRRDTAAAWTSANPILAQGEPGFEHDTAQLPGLAWDTLAAVLETVSHQIMISQSPWATQNILP
jgi:hypothetical protein